MIVSKLKSHVIWTAVLFGLFAALLAPTFALSGGHDAPFFSSCQKLWSHHGLQSAGPENSLRALSAAFDQGAGGVELDVYFDEKYTHNFYVVSEETFASTGHGSLNLEEVLRLIGSRGYIWIDFWNLKQLTRTAAEDAAQTLGHMLAARGLLAHAIVESTDADNLSLFVTKGLYTSYWIQPPAIRDGDRAYWSALLRYKYNYLKGGYSAISMDQEAYDQRMDLLFERVPLHVFTVNEESRLEFFLRKNNVKVILTDTANFKRAGC
jgi:hypothetical protein